MYPAPLRAGDRIFVTAPSSGVPGPLHARLDIVIDHLRAQGYQVEEGRCLRAHHNDQSAAAEQRAQELQDALIRADVHAVLPPWGGERAMELLHRIDWDALGAATPKWFAGFSDLSTLMLPLLLRSGWASVHGANLMELSPSQTAPLYQASMTALTRRQLEPWELGQSSHHLSERQDWTEAPESAYGLNTPTRWQTLDGRESVQATGRLVGGCLDTLMHLVGTPFGDLPAFRARVGEDGIILFLENCDLPPVDVLRGLLQMRAAGWLDARALVLGRSARAAEANSDGMSYRDAVNEALGDLPLPVLLEADVGHVPPQLPLIQGALATLRWHHTEGGRVRQEFR